MTSLFDPEILEHDASEAVPLEFELLDRSVAVVDPNAERVAELEQRILALEAQIAAEREAAKMESALVRTEAIAEARAEGEAQRELEIVSIREGVVRAIDGFTKERSRYFAEIEGETVSLALAIAKRILHREATMDSMLLKAAVRIALEKVGKESGVRLRVPAQEVDGWSELIASQPSSEFVAVIGDPHLSAADAVLETEVGRIELGLTSQLKEIERGFFDLLAKRPQ